jgi:hypothetical protein
MQPVRRRVRRHFGLTAKRVSVRSYRPWYFRVVLAILFVCIGFGLAYWILHSDDIETVKKKLDQTTLENKELEAKLIAAQRELQVELATNNNLAKQLTTVQDENIKAKADLYFYKNMMNGKRPK